MGENKENKEQPKAKEKEDKEEPTKKVKGTEMPESEAREFQAKNVGTVLDIKRGGLGKERTFTYKESHGELEKMLREA